MTRFPRPWIGLLLVAGSLVPMCALVSAQARSTATIQRVRVLGSGSSVEVEIIASQPLVPHAQMITGPDRLVIDLPNSTPASGLHNASSSRGEMKGVRVGLFQAHPPVTRVVLDLKKSQPYQVSHSGNTVIVKLGGGAKLVATSASRSSSGPAILGTLVGGTVSEPPVAKAKPAQRVEVHFGNGSLSIWADKATLAEVLNEVHRRTGADIPIPAGAEQEQVVANYGPAPAREVLAALLNGSRFNFIMVGSDRDPGQLRSVILSLRGGPASQPMGYAPPPEQPMAQAMPEAVPPQPADEAAPPPPDQPAAAEGEDSPR